MQVIAALPNSCLHKQSDDASPENSIYLEQREKIPSVVDNEAPDVKVPGPVWPENSIYLKQREIIPGVVDNETTRCQSAWTRSVSC